MTIKKAILFLCILLCITKVNAQTADEIINNYIKAIGGKDAWTKIRSMKQDAVLNVNGTEINISLIAEHNKGYRQTVSFSGMSGFTIFTPKAGWNYYPWQGHQKAEAITPEDLQEAQDNL